jgi:serine protease
MTRAIGCVVAVAAIISSPLTRGQQQADPNSPPAPVSVMSADDAQAFADAAAGRLDYLPGQVLVKFKDGVEAPAEQRALDAIRSRPSIDRLQWIGDVAILRDPTQPDARILAGQLASQPEVVFAQPNYLRHKSLTPNDTGYGPRQWNFQAIDMPHAWDINPGGRQDLIVAVVDTGITTFNGTLNAQTWNGSAIQTISLPFTTNPDLNAARLVLPRDFVTGGGTTVLDTDGHGTHVSSTIGEDTNNQLLDAGIAYNVKIMPVKVCVSYWDVQFAMSAAGTPGFADPNAVGCPTSAIAAGIHYAVDNNAKIINLSLGGEGTSPTEQSALQYALDHGVFVAIAAGNAQQTGNAPQYPAAYAPAMPGVMAVGATNRSGNRASYSSSGSYVEIAAPGGDPNDSDASGSGYIWQSTIRPSASDPSLVIFPRFDSYGEVGYAGTSMASPHVAGLAALLYSQGITTPSALESAIKKSAKFLGTPSASDPTRNDDFGAGLIQPRAALFGLGLRK